MCLLYFNSFHFVSPFSKEKSFVAALVIIFNHFRSQVWGTELSSLSTLKKQITHINKQIALLIWQGTLNWNLNLHIPSKLVVKVSMEVKYFANFNSLKKCINFFLFYSTKQHQNFYVFFPLDTGCMSNNFHQLSLFTFFSYNTSFTDFTHIKHSAFFSRLSSFDQCIFFKVSQALPTSLSIGSISLVHSKLYKAYVTDLINIFHLYFKFFTFPILVF